MSGTDNTNTGLASDTNSRRLSDIDYSLPNNTDWGTLSLAKLSYLDGLGYSPINNTNTGLASYTNSRRLSDIDYSLPNNTDWGTVSLAKLGSKDNKINLDYDNNSNNDNNNNIDDPSKNVNTGDWMTGAAALGNVGLGLAQYLSSRSAYRNQLKASKYALASAKEQDAYLKNRRANFDKSSATTVAG